MSTTLQKSTLDVLHHLSRKKIHLQLLAYFYDFKDIDPPIKHRDIQILIKSKSVQYTSQYILAMTKFQLIKRITSVINEQNLGYKITPKGIKFFEMYKEIEANLN